MKSIFYDLSVWLGTSPEIIANVFIVYVSIALSFFITLHHTGMINMVERNPTFRQKIINNLIFLTFFFLWPITLVILAILEIGIKKRSAKQGIKKL